MEPNDNTFYDKLFALIKKHQVRDEEKTFKYVQVVIRNEGLHYALHSYSRFEQVEDEKFHTLRKAYLKVTKDLEEYIAIKVEAEENAELNTED